jgi:hypothetical protein
VATLNAKEGQAAVMMGFIRIEQRPAWIQDRQISWNPNFVGEINISPGQKAPFVLFCGVVPIRTL